MFLGEEIFKGFTIYCHDSHIGHVNTILYAFTEPYCHDSHIGHVNTILYAFTEPNSKETCYNQLSPLEEIT